MFGHQTTGLVINTKLTKPYPFTDLATKPTCFFRPAIEANKEYAQGLLALSKKRSRMSQSNNPLANIKRVRMDNALLVAKFCLEGWEDQKDEAGNDVPFTKDNGFEFLKVVARDADWIFDALYAWLRNPNNFASDNNAVVDVFEDIGMDELDDIMAESENESDDSLGKS